MPLRSVSQAIVIKFIEEQIIHRFGLPESITADQSSVFIGNETLSFAESRGIKILNSTPYYAQANGQVEAIPLRSVSQATIIKFIEE